MLNNLLKQAKSLNKRATRLEKEYLPQPKPKKKIDIAIGVAFVGAIAALLVVAGYVISRISGDQAYRERWKDYNDCGWA